MVPTNPIPDAEAGHGDPHDLQRFVSAQAPVYPRVVAELTRGRKTSHWMWFVFPQLRGLGRSSMAHAYGLASAGEAIAYAAHPLLGLRLRECARLAGAAGGRGQSVDDIFGAPDDLKLLSCLTLFEAVTADPAFTEARQALFGADVDGKTLQLLRRR